MLCDNRPLVKSKTSMNLSSPLRVIMVIQCTYEAFLIEGTKA
jgi:hypothetical protein